jgi:hypothetical protein
MTQSPGNRQEDVLGKSQLRKGLQSLERYLVINGWESFLRTEKAAGERAHVH